MRMTFILQFVRSASMFQIAVEDQPPMARGTLNPKLFKLHVACYQRLTKVS